MRIEIISTGDEIVTGLVVDTNAAWLSAPCWSRAGRCAAAPPWGQPRGSDSRAAGERQPRRGGTGVRGLGPTADDLTAQAAAEAFDQPLTLFPDWLATMAERYASRGRTMARSNTKQAWLPRDCEILDNPVGTACGFVVRHPASHGQSRLSSPRACRSSSSRWCANRSCPASRRWPGKRRTPSCAVSTPSASRSPPSATCWMRPLACRHRAGLPLLHALIELKLIGHGASTADMDAAEARLLAAIAPWLVGVATRRLPARSWPLLGSGRCTCKKGRAGAPCWPCVTGTRP